MSATNTKTSPRSLLIVDDDEMDVYRTKRVISSQTDRIEVASVGDGVDALKYLRQEDQFTQVPRPDLILLDLNMPRMGGREFLAIAKSDDALRSIPIVVVSTSKSPADVERCYKLQANSFITKSMDFDSFHLAMRACAQLWLDTRFSTGSPANGDAAVDLPAATPCILNCQECGVTIPPIRMVENGPVSRWKCSGCNEELVGELFDDDWMAGRSNLQPVGYFSETNQGPEIAPEIHEFAHQLVARDLQDGRRDSPRHPLVMQVPVIQLDKDLYPQGTAFNVLTRNISASGIGLLHTEQIEGHVAIQINFPGGEASEFVLRIARCNRVAKLFEIGGVITGRLS